jgi:Flp pilus assembly protein CpaB
VKDGETLQGSSATLELLPKQAEALERAKKQGDVALALRSVGDGPADMRLAGGQGTVGASAGDQPQAAVRVHGYSMMSETLFSAQ